MYRGIDAAGRRRSSTGRELRLRPGCQLLRLPDLRLGRWDKRGGRSEPRPHRRGRGSPVGCEGADAGGQHPEPRRAGLLPGSPDQDLEVNGYDNRWAGPGWGGWGGGPSQARVERVPVGTLVVGMVDAKTRSIVWRTAATKDLNLGDNPEKWEKNSTRRLRRCSSITPGRPWRQVSEGRISLERPYASRRD